MKIEIANQLLTLNQQFYQSLAKPFVQTRALPQPGFFELWERREEWGNLLDVGCGDGRWGRFVAERNGYEQYIGIDFSENLLASARTQEEKEGRFYQGDMSQPGFLDQYEQFDSIVCLAALQHIPRHVSRVRLLAELKEHLLPGGLIGISTWQFMNSERQRRKVQSWSEIGLTEVDVEETDYLLNWQSGGYGLRYLCFLDQAQMNRLADEVGLTIVDQFYADGREKNLALYTLFQDKG